MSTIVNRQTALLITALVREIQGCTYIYDCYLDVAFKKVSKGRDLTNVNPDTVKQRALEICALKSSDNCYG